MSHAHEKLEGALVDLTPVTAADVGQILSDMRVPDMYRKLCEEEPPDAARLKEILVRNPPHTRLWRMTPKGEGKPIGYAGAVILRGPPMVFYHVLNEDHDAGLDALGVIAPWFFANLGEDEREVNLFVPKSLAAELEEDLSSLGFDLDDCEFPERYVAHHTPFIMWRQTYEAYYCEAEDDDPYY